MAIVDYVDQQFQQYYCDESGLNRRNIVDNRVHCCLYFISPYGHGYVRLQGAYVCVYIYYHKTFFMLLLEASY